jgi:predicted AAA+ superfamily ATPase
MTSEEAAMLREIYSYIKQAIKNKEEMEARIASLESNVASLLIDIATKDSELRRMTELYKSSCQISEQRRQRIVELEDAK